MIRGQKVPVFSACFDLGSQLTGCPVAAHARAAYGINAAIGLSHITAKPEGHPLAPGNKAFNASARIRNRLQTHLAFPPAGSATSPATSNPITKVSSTFRTLKLSGNAGRSCGSTDYPVRV